MTLIKLESISKVYGKSESEVVALKNISLSIEKGEMIAIMGKSGSGKSTLLNIIGCLDKQSSGEYYLNGKSISKYSNRELAITRNSTFGFVVQHFALINSYTVYENVEIPLQYNINRVKNKKKLIIESLKKLGIEEKVKRYPSELSGGQCQRVAIARAIVNDSEIVLADEPTGALDSETGKNVLNILRELNIEGKTVIIVTHDSSIANECDRIIKLKDGNIFEDRKII